MNYLLFVLIMLFTLALTAVDRPALASFRTVSVNVPKDNSVNGSERHKNCRYRNGFPKGQFPFDHACRVNNSPQYVPEQTHENNHKEESGS
jgi:hypothetical protein